MADLFDILNVNPAQSVQPQSLMQKIASDMGRNIQQAGGQDTRTTQQKVQSAVKGGDTTTSQGLLSIAQRLEAVGESSRAMQFRELAVKKKGEEGAAQQSQQYRESIVQRAIAVGDTSQATSARTASTAQLAEIVEDIQKQEELKRTEARTKAVSMAGEPARRQMWEQAGLPPSEFDPTIPSEDFAAILEGREAEPLMYQNDSGEVISGNTNKYGLIYDEKSKSFKSPSQLGLIAAPDVQMISNKADPLTTILNSPAGETFFELTTNARDASKTVSTANRSMDLLNEGINSGTFSTPLTALGNIASALGMDNAFTQTAANTQEFIATRAAEVATYIKAFGAGTGLSDADREFAKIGVGADPKVQAQALRNLIAIQVEIANGIMAQHNDIYNKLAADPEVNGTLMSLFSVLPPREATQLSESARQYLEGN